MAKEIVYTVHQVECLRDKKVVGDFVRFHSSKDHQGISVSDDQTIINGFITKIFPHTFALDDGQIFTWVDYLLGYEY